jgi:hypothetical protein
MPSINESMNSYIQIGFHSIGISIVNDVDEEDLIYLSLNPTKDIWTETRKFNVKPICQDLSQSLDEHYKTFIQSKSKSKQIKNKFEIDKNRVKI